MTARTQTQRQPQKITYAQTVALASTTRNSLAVALIVTLGSVSCQQQTIPPHTHEECTQQSEAITMASENPPSGWEVTLGTWGTDIIRDESTTLTGQSALKFPSTGANASILSPWTAVGGVQSPSSGYTDNLYYSAYSRWKSSSTTAGHEFSIQAIYYDKDRNQLTTDNLFYGVATSSNTWIGSGKILRNQNIRWVRILISKADQPFDLYIDSVVVKKLTPSAMSTGYQASGYGPPPAIPTGTWTPVSLYAVTNLTTDTYHQIEAGIATTGDYAEAAVYDPGLYLVTGQVTYTDLLDGETAGIRISYTDFDAGAITTAPFYNQAAKDNGDLSVGTSLVVGVESPNTVIRLETWHDGSGDRNTGEEGCFSVTRIGM